VTFTHGSFPLVSDGEDDYYDGESVKVIDPEFAF